MANLMSVFAPRAGLEATTPAIILPASSPTPFTFSYDRLHTLVLDLQSQLASFGLQPGTTISSSLINGIEFTLAFLATGAERLVAAPLNPNYSQGEVEFYLQDTQSKLILLPKGALAKGHPAVKRRRK